MASHTTPKLGGGHDQSRLMGVAIAIYFPGGIINTCTEIHAI